MTGRSDRQPKPRVSRQGSLWRGTFSAMAGPCEVLFSDASAAEAERWLEAVVSEVDRIQRKYSRYREDSVLSRINALAGEWMEVDDETARLLDFAQQVFELSDGAFDISSGVLRRAWTFDGRETVPSRARIDALLAFVGFEKVDWDGRRIRVPAGMELDFGGLGKEYAVDRAVARLADDGARHFLVNLGGDLRVSGPRSDGSPWTVAVESPSTEGEAVRNLNLSSGALATSGDARRFVMVEGRRLGHILDPRTGWPVEGAPRSVTVQAPNCVEAGFLATLAILQGPNAEGFLQQQEALSWCIRGDDD